MSRSYYSVNIRWSAEDSCYVASVPALPGCMADGETLTEVAAATETAIEMWIETAIKLGRPIPVEVLVP